MNWRAGIEAAAAIAACMSLAVAVAMLMAMLIQRFGPAAWLIGLIVVASIGGGLIVARDKA